MGGACDLPLFGSALTRIADDEESAYLRRIENVKTAEEKKM